MSTEQNNKYTDNQQPSGPVPLLRYPVAWTGTGHTNDVTGACELSDRRLLSWSRDENLRLWSSEGQELRVLTGHTSYVYGACELSDRRLLSWSFDDTLRLWSSGGEELRVLTGHTSIVLGACELSDRRLLSWSDDRTLRLWSSEGEEIRALTGHTDQVLGACELSDRRLLSWCYDGALRLWSSEGKELRVYTDVRGACHLSDRRLLSWGHSTLRLWNVQGEELQMITELRVQTEHASTAVQGAIELSDGRLLSWFVFKNTLQLWNSEGEEIRELIGHTSDVKGAIELSDRRLLSWSADGTLRLWSSEGEELRVLTEHTECVYDARELSDGRLLSCSGRHDFRRFRQRYMRYNGDNALRLWSSAGEELGVLGRIKTTDVDIAGDLSVLYSRQGSVIRGYSYTSGTAVTWQMSSSSGKVSVRENTPQPDPKKAAATIVRTIKKYATDDTAVYLSLRSTWATEVLLELDRKVLLHIRGIQCTDAKVYEDITGVMPELELDLLQFTRLLGTETLNTLYGVQAQRVLMYCCNDLHRLEGSNCLIDTVEIVDCPQLGYVRVSGMVGEAEVVRLEYTDGENNEHKPERQAQ